VYTFEERNTFDTNDFKYNLDAYKATNYVSQKYESDDISEYITFTVQPGTYTNSAIMVKLEAGAFEVNPLKNHFLKLGYKTNIKGSSIIDINSSKGDSWLKESFKLTNDSEWHDIIVDIESALEGSAGDKYPDINDPKTSIYLKLWGSHDKTLNTAEYISIRYMAFFETLEEAEAYTYEPMSEEEYLKLFSFDNVDLDVAKEAEVREYLAKAEALKKEILEYEGTLDVSGTKYYVSESDGNDANDGLSPDTPWKTVAMVNEFKFSEGDGVYFKRGDVWREPLYTQNGVTYTAYGTGDKPTLYGSIDGTDPALWSETEYENIWEYAEVFGERADERFPGNIVFNNETAWGVKVDEDSANPGYTTNRQICWNGIEYVDNTSVEMTDLTFLRGNHEFFYDPKTTKLYMYFDKGNPGDYFDSIEICLSGNAIKSNPGSKRVTIDNICMKYFTNHGVSGFNVKDYTVQYCVIGFIGGNGLGNAIESWTNADNFYVHHNYAYQCYDCAFTAQGTVTDASVTIQNVTMHDNIAEFCNSGLEFWLGTSDEWYEKGYRGVMKNVELYDNYTLYGGYGWSNQRPGKDGNFFYGGLSKSNTTYENIDVYNNVNMFSTKIGLRSNYVSEDGGFNFNRNIYFIPASNAMFQTSRLIEDFMCGITRNYTTHIYNIARLQNFGVEQGAMFRTVSTNYLPFGFNGVYDILPGDINGDGDIMPDDEIILARYLAMYERGDLIFLEKNADFDDDGVITPLDSSLLARSIAGYN
ncbi:MAG: dockerin type I repeat-containing protein, partial [Clostridia bacterium]|nr:dockerin type I repeat-containing protein [Clostridia bacterium]